MVTGIKHTKLRNLNWAIREHLCSPATPLDHVPCTAALTAPWGLLYERPELHAYLVSSIIQPPLRPPKHLCRSPTHQQQEPDLSKTIYLKLSNFKAFCINLKVKLLIHFYFRHKKDIFP